MTLNIPGALFRQNDVRETQTDETTVLGIATQIMGGNVGEKVFNNGATFFFPIFGGFTTAEFSSPNEAQANIIIPKTGTIKNLFTYVGTNAIDAITSIQITVRVNGSDSSLQTSYTSTQTGAQSDTTNTVSVTAGDRIAIEIDTANDGASNALNISWGLEFSQV